MASVSIRVFHSSIGASFRFDERVENPLDSPGFRGPRHPPFGGSLYAPGVSWKVHPEPADPEELAALVAAAEQAFAPPEESAWWRSGLEDLDGGTPAELARHDPGVVEP